MRKSCSRFAFPSCLSGKCSVSRCRRREICRRRSHGKKHLKHAWRQDTFAAFNFKLIYDSQDLLEGGQDHWFCPGTTAMSAATFDDRYDKAVFSLRLVEYKPKDRVLLWRTGLEKCMTCVRCIEGYVRAKAILVEQ